MESDGTCQTSNDKRMCCEAGSAHSFRFLKETFTESDGILYSF
ncbi:unnamed protein product [Larinioides sclopetarius]|uniref:Uncharacterized protein n=1 Tax=Larinioides sclopetarius TaxID=280406 RepID=A0AAV1Z5G6_9ARAC